MCQPVNFYLFIYFFKFYLIQYLFYFNSFLLLFNFWLIILIFAHKGLVSWPADGLLSRSCRYAGHRFKSHLNLKAILVGSVVPPSRYSGSWWDSTLCNVSMIPPPLPIPLDIKKKLYLFLLFLNSNLLFTNLFIYYYYISLLFIIFSFSTSCINS